MIIRVTDLDLKDAFLAKAKRMGLSISNDADTRTGIEHIVLGCSMSVGTSDKFHINWARDIDYYAKKGVTPVYDISYDWIKISKRLDQYVASLGKRLELSDTSVATVKDNTVEFENGIVLSKEGLEAIKIVATLGLNIDFYEENIDICGDSFINVDDIDRMLNELKK